MTTLTMDALLAREAIRVTLSEYHMAGDRGRVDELVLAFTEDGTLELASGSHVGRDAIRAALSGVRTAAPSQAPIFVRHHLTTSHVELRSETAAEGWNYFFVTSPIGLDHAGRYVDRYARIGDRWLIAHRRVVVEWAAEGSAVGARSAAATATRPRGQ